jgi:hypothetical protein
MGPPVFIPGRQAFPNQMAVHSSESRYRRMLHGLTQQSQSWPGLRNPTVDFDDVPHSIILVAAELVWGSSA